MEFQFSDALPVLRRTPTVLRALLLDLPGPWIEATEGPGTWSPLWDGGASISRSWRKRYFGVRAGLRRPFSWVIR